MLRRRTDLQELAIDTWLTVDINALAKDKRTAFEARERAIRLYASGEVLRKIEKETGINSRQVYALLSRCLTQADDGRMYGFRGLLKHQRIGLYVRIAPLAPSCSATGQGFVAAFSILLERYPALTQWLQKKIDEDAVVLDQRSTDDGLKTRLRGIVRLHTAFLQQCRRAGITAEEYPLNTHRTGIAALSTYIKSLLLKNFGTAARANNKLCKFFKWRACRQIYPDIVVKFSKVYAPSPLEKRTGSLQVLSEQENVQRLFKAYSPPPNSMALNLTHCLKRRLKNCRLGLTQVLMNCCR